MGRFSPEQGDVIDGRIALIEKIGEGGLGQVWKATLSGRTVCIKFYDKFPEWVAQMEQETQLCFSLANEPVEEARFFITMHFFEPASGEGHPPYLIMEYVDGQDIARRLKRGAIPRTQALDICEALLRALSFAHEKGFHHGDIKPSNIIIPECGSPVIKITDFGFGAALELKFSDSESLEPSGPQEQQASQTPSIIGGTTQLYYPRERYAPDERKRYISDPKLRAACDLYAVGKTLLEMFTAKPLGNVLSLEEDPGELSAGFEQFLMNFLRSKGGYPSGYESAKEALGALWKLQGKKGLAVVLTSIEGGSSLTLDSEPQAAAVYLEGPSLKGGRYVGRTPVTIPGLKEGMYTVKFEIKYFKPSVEEVKLDGRDATYKKVKLQPIRADLHVDSVPQRAVLTLDGKKIGATPVTAYGVVAGVHRVILELEGYRGLETEVEISSPGMHELRFKLDEEVGYRQAVEEIEELIAGVKLEEAEAKIREFEKHFANTRKPGEMLSRIGAIREEFGLLMEKARQAIVMRQYTRAENLIRKAQKVIPHSTEPENLLREIELKLAMIRDGITEARGLMDKEEWAAAIAALDKVLAIEPLNEVALTFKAHIEDALKKKRSQLKRKEIFKSFILVVCVWIIVIGLQILFRERWDFRTLVGHNGVVLSVVFSPDGKLLASGSHDRTIRLWDVSSGREIRTLVGHKGDVNSVAFSPDGKLLASGSHDRTIRLWDVSSGYEVWTPARHTFWVGSIAFSPDGNILASGGLDHTIKLWDVSSCRVVRTLVGHGGWVRTIAFSPDGNILASGSLDHIIKLWDVSSCCEARTIEGHGGWLNSVAFSPDGNVIASGSNYAINLWDVPSGRRVRTLVGHTGDVNSVVFSPDGKMLASGGRDGTIKLWHVPPD